MTTNPTNVPNRNQPQQGIPPLPFLHVSVDSTRKGYELRIITPGKLLCLFGNETLNVSDYAVKHGLLGITSDMIAHQVVKK